MLLFATTAFGQLPASLPLRPAGLAADNAGNLYYADTLRNQVFESTAAGALKLLAGTGEQGFLGDGAAATLALLNAPQALALAPDGTLYIADSGNNRIRAISPSGTITTVASSLHAPAALALDPAGDLLIADTAAHRVLRLTGAAIFPVAGTGEEGFAGDNGPATASLLDSPSGLAVLPDGRILIADTHNHRIRAVALNGTITTFAGNGTRGYSGDNGPATAAQLAFPRGLATFPDGTILLADSDNHRLRSISPTGVITSLVGTSTQATSPDTTPGNAATLDTPRAVAVNAYGAAIFTDHLLQALLSQTLYNTATETPRTSNLTLTTTSTSATVTVQGTAGTPQGSITLLDGATPLATAPLASATVTIPFTLMPGSHLLTATYSGDAFNPAASSSTTINGSLIPTTTTLNNPGTAYAGMPLTLTGTTFPPAATGTLTFTEAGSTIATAHLANGTANAIYLAPTAGQHAIVATYSGDNTYAASSSATVIATAVPMPDFTLTVLNPTQTANNGATVSYALTLTALSGPFTGAVSLSATGLPAGTPVTFSPPQVIPGAATVSSTMSIPTDKLLATNPSLSPVLCVLIVLPLLRRRCRKHAVVGLLIFTAGCGTRIAPNSVSSTSPRTFNLTITGVATNLVGVLVTHSAQATLVVQ